MLKQKIRALAFICLTAPFCAVPVWADISSFTVDLEDLDKEDPAALGDSGWVVFGNVFSGTTGDYLYGYGTFPAPNDGAAFSAIVADEGGAGQGAQQLSIFSDYGNLIAHGAGDLVEANVFREQSIGAADVGKTYVFSFDAKRGNLEGATTAIAFIKTLNPAAGFALTNFVMVEMTGIPDNWGRYNLSLEIDAGLPGQLFQTGFSSTATNFEGSGIFYDNIVLEEPLDSDGDGLADSADNCVTFANADQTDTDADGFGNACDPDLDNNCSVNFIDLGLFKAGFTPVNDANADFAGGPDGGPDGFVNFIDLGRMKQLFFNQTEPGPGPSGLATCQP